MLLSTQQKFILEVLRRLGCVRREQLHALVRGRFQQGDFEIPLARMGAMLRQLRMGAADVWLDNELVWLVECYGHDVDLTQRELSYTAIPDLREKYHPGDELDCVVKGYNAACRELQISVKETESNPFEGAELRHPVGSRRYAVIAGKYGGGVFCNLPDGTLCMCNYSYQHEDSDFLVGDHVMLVVHRFEPEKRQMYGKILNKWWQKARTITFYTRFNGGPSSDMIRSQAASTWG